MLFSFKPYSLRITLNNIPRVKRVIVSSIASLLILLLAAAGYFYYQFTKVEQAKMIDAVPADVAWIASLDPTSGDLKRIANNPFFIENQNSSSLADVQQSLILLDSLADHQPVLKELFLESPLLVSAHPSGSGSFGLVFYLSVKEHILRKSFDQTLRDALPVSGTTNKRDFAGREIYVLKLKGKHELSWTISRGVFMASFNTYLLEDAIRQQQRSEPARSVFPVSEYFKTENRQLMFAVRYQGAYDWMKGMGNDNNRVAIDLLGRLGEWTIVKLNNQQHSLTYQGQTIVSDTLSFIKVFSDQAPVQRTLFRKLPSRTVASVIWGFDDPVAFINSLNTNKISRSQNTDEVQLANSAKTWLGEEVALVMIHGGPTNAEKGFLTFMQLKDEKACLLSLEQNDGHIRQELYSGVVIKQMKKQSVFRTLFGPLFTPMNKCYYSVIDGYLVAANQVSALRTYINDIKTGNYLSSVKGYDEFSEHVPLKGNLLFYCNMPLSEEIMRSLAAPLWLKWFPGNGSVFKNWNAFVFSVSAANGVFNTSGCIGYFSDSKEVKNEVCAARTDTAIAAGPFHAGGNDSPVFVTDVSNALYAFDLTGKRLWKKQLDSPLMGSVHNAMIEDEENGYYVFNTRSFVYILDKDGNASGSSPVRLQASASAGLSLRTNSSGTTEILVACNNLRLYNFQLRKGFNAKPDYRLLPGNTQLPVIEIADVGTLCLLDDGSGIILKGNGGRIGAGNKVSPLKNQPILPSVDSAVYFYFLSSADSLIYGVMKNGSVKGVFNDQTEKFTSLALADVNADGEQDWILGTSNGISARTRDGLVIFKQKFNNPVSQINFISKGNKGAIACLSGSDVFVLGQDGTIRDGLSLSNRRSLIFSFSDPLGTLFVIDDNNELLLVKVII